MRIIVDTRENAPFSFSRWPDVETVHSALDVGDYSIPGFEDEVAIERKSLNDLVGCLMDDNRDRFERELRRARPYRLFTIVVEASYQDVQTGRYRSKMDPHAVTQSLMAFHVRYGAPVLWAGSRRNAEYITFSLLSKYLQETKKRWTRMLRQQPVAI